MFYKTDLTLIITPSGDCISLVCETVALLSRSRVRGQRGPLFYYFCVLSHPLTRKEIMLTSPFGENKILKLG